MYDYSAVPGYEDEGGPTRFLVQTEQGTVTVNFYDQMYHTADGQLVTETLDGMLASLEHADKKDPHATLLGYSVQCPDGVWLQMCGPCVRYSDTLPLEVEPMEGDGWDGLHVQCEACGRTLVAAEA